MSADIEVRGLVHHYTAGRCSLDGVSFRVAAGRCVGLLGPNGAGKSTLLQHLNGLLPELPVRREACVSIGGVPVTAETLHAVRRHVGFLFQDPDDQLLSSTVFEDVAFGPRQFGLAEAELVRRVRESLAAVGLQGYEQRQPRQLSQGEKRRVCLAGVLVCEPDVLVLDEPSSGLDPRGRREFIKLVRGLPCTRLIATHDLELAVELCEEVLVLDGGRVVAQGPCREVLADEALMLAHGLERPHSLSHPHVHNR